VGLVYAVVARALALVAECIIVQCTVMSWLSGRHRR